MPSKSQAQSKQNTRNSPPSNRQLLIIFSIFGGLILSAVWLLTWLVNSLVWLIPPSVEQQLGALIVPAYEQLAKPTPAQDTLNQLLDRLEANLPPQSKNRDYQVLYVPDSTVNALAIPGDRIIIYSGLVKQVQSENELMMVLGHKLGHFANRAHLRSLGQQLLYAVIFGQILCPKKQRQVVIASVIGDAGWIQSTAVSGIAALSNAQYFSISGTSSR